jgi:hypothetical protein
MCGDEDIVVDLRVIEPLSTEKYVWFRNGLKVLGATNASLTFNSVGTYKVLATEKNGCSVFSNEIIIQKSENTTVGITVVDDANLQADVPNSSEGFFQWYLNGAEIEGATSATIQITSGGSYTVGYTNIAGCQTISEVVVITSISDDWLKSITSLYPNPTEGKVQISFSEILKGETKLRVYNLVGELISEKIISNSTTTSLDLSSKASGIYILEISNQKGNTRMKITKK